MTEQQIQSKIKKKLQLRGYFVTKLIKTSTNGIPDLLAIKDGQATFIEVKKENGILSPLQELRLSELKKHGCLVYVWSDFETNF
jgi:Holliday junction resolvase